MRRERASGILAHPTSFPGPHGIGDVGAGAFQFVDWLADGKQRYWQVMPLGPTGLGDSPYASPSAFAGNPLLISLNRLYEIGLNPQLPDPAGLSFDDHEVQFRRAHEFKMAALRRAFESFKSPRMERLTADFETFRSREAPWLRDYALFMAIKGQFGGQSWPDWPEDLRLRHPDALARAVLQLDDEIRFHEFVQFLFRWQWYELKRYANEQGVQLIGDIPIYVALDSADVWARRDLFRLTPAGTPEVVSGVPPDLFTRDGQLWGNPVFGWNRMARDNYQWWVSRLQELRELVDVVRIDHFRGFAAGWVVPATDPTARTGHWERGPGESLFQAIFESLGKIPIIVEDLGIITPDVHELRDAIGLPGMKVLQFAFDGDPSNQYLPHMYPRNCVVYTGTHDNQTTIGWFQSLTERDHVQVQTYIGADGSDIAWNFIRLAFSSVADLAMVPLQDVMRLGDEARMNTPGRPFGNWTWRYLPHQLHDGLSAGLREFATAYGRRHIVKAAPVPDEFDYSAPGSKHPLHDPRE
jgi:4-alpha-glucanotransferase